TISRAAELGDGWLPSMPDPDGLARGLDLIHAASEAAGRRDLPVVALSLPSALRLTAPGAMAGRTPLMTPDAAIAQLKGYESLGVAHVALGFPMPNESVYLQQIEYFAAEVLPAFA